MANRYGKWRFKKQMFKWVVGAHKHKNTTDNTKQETND